MSKPRRFSSTMWLVTAAVGVIAIAQLGNAIWATCCCSPGAAMFAWFAEGVCAVAAVTCAVLARLTARLESM